jgi:segregation and condensation protein A
MGAANMDDALFVDRVEVADAIAQYEVRLDKFSGPLDLLLYLIRKDELNIADIPIAHITQQYLNYLDIMRSLDLEVAGEYILMAATLIRIKAQMLLPRQDEESEDDDPRRTLVAALLEYRQFKEASGILHRYESDERTKYPAYGDMPSRRIEETLQMDATVFDLVTVMGELLKRASADQAHEVTSEPYSVEDQIAIVRARLEHAETLLLSDLLGSTWTRGLLVVTFLALLELTRLSIIFIEQTAHCHDIKIVRRQTVESPSVPEGGL